MTQFWPEAQGKIHIDAWREVTQVDGYAVKVVEKTEAVESIPPEDYFL